MNTNVHQVLFLFNIYFENQYGRINPQDFNGKTDSHHKTIASDLWDIFQKLCDKSVEIENEEFLYIENDAMEYENVSQKSSSTANKLNKSKSAPDMEPPEKKGKHDLDYDWSTEVMEPSDRNYSFETIKKIVELKDKKGQTLKSIQGKYPWVQFIHLTRFRKYVEAEGTFLMKMKEVEKFVQNKFQESRDNELKPVHDIILRRWAIDKSKEIGFENFKASPTFVKNLKSRLEIKSRKVTKIVTRRYSTEKVDLDQKTTAHLELTNSALSSYNPKFVFNSDQSNFTKEFYSTRTLSHKGEKHTLLTVNSISNTTHSYTIQPTISAAGELLSPMLICLQETTGNEFGPKVKEQIEANTPENLVVVCSKSGKLTKEHVKVWINNCLTPHVTEKSLLLTDSWSGQTDEFLNESLPIEKKNLLATMTIPAGTTSLCQPLDVYFFRQYKVFVRRIYDEMMLESNEEEAQNRLFFLKLHSLIHNQFLAEAFRPMLKYAWFKSGYHVSDPGKFKNVTEICFDKKDVSQNCDNCGNLSFMTCAHCNKYLCLTDFLKKVCWH